MPGAEVERVDLELASGATRCAAWLFRPRSAARPPVVVMAHGFAGTRELGLPAYAERFAARGLACLVFDYRHFGASGGEPRQLLDVERQLDDWRAAVAAARSLEGVDGGRLGLWGTSFSGGHVLVLAAEDPGVRAAVAQVPFVDGRARPPAGVRPGQALRALGAALWDALRGRLGLAPHAIPVVAPPGRFAALPAPDAWEGYRSLLPADGPGGWRNAVAARALLQVPRYRPGLRAAAVGCPLLLVAARRDSLIPLAAVEDVAARAPRATLEVVDAAHFEVYTGALFERLADREAAFLAGHLR